MTILPPLNGLRAFEVAARTGSYVSAAAELHVSPSAVSRLVKLLEQRLNVALFERLPNGLVLTERGAAYLSDLTAAFDRIGQATERLTSSGSMALLIGAGPTLAMRWLIPRLPGFHKKHPDIDVRLSTAIAGADPMRPDWTAAIRAGDGAWPGFASHFLFTADLFPVCAPALARGLRTPSDLSKTMILQVANAPEDWALWLKAADVHFELGHSKQFDYPAFALQAALDGLGVAMARAPFVADDLAAGRLVRPFGLNVPKGAGWWLVHRPHHEGNPALQAFRAWLLNVAKAAA
ncbi:MAG: LysR family transcriptional regulator [Alphaproteobacteria bacterium]|nr:LysR family transcriptional regulator [Alphaproteobacteria bacterium]